MVLSLLVVGVTCSPYAPLSLPFLLVTIVLLREHLMPMVVFENLLQILEDNASPVSGSGRLWAITYGISKSAPQGRSTYKFEIPSIFWTLSYGNKNKVPFYTVESYTVYVYFMTSIMNYTSDTRTLCLTYTLPRGS